jgi:membrane associated rhomboid family serine protease
MPALDPAILIILSVVIVSVIGFVIPPLRRGLTLVPFRVREKGEVWRLLTAGWVHGGLGHLAVNMFSLYFFAETAARALGEKAFVALYVSSVVLSFVPSMLQKMHQPKYSTLGASGAVSAVMFSAILLYPRMKIMAMFIPIPVPAVLFAAAYLAYTAWQSASGDSEVNHTAHFAGAIYGVLFTYAFEPARVEAAFAALRAAF